MDNVYRFYRDTLPMYSLVLLIIRETLWSLFRKIIRVRFGDDTNGFLVVLETEIIII